jgi:diacylglycerol O-acyltransferase / wax synthase
MSSIDAAWLGMEDPTNLMMVTGVLTLEGRVDVKRLRTVQKVVRPRTRGNLPHWADDPKFDIENHVTHGGLPAQGGDKARRNMVSGLMSEPLDFTKPLWHVHVIDGYHGGSVTAVGPPRAWHQHPQLCRRSQARRRDGRGPRAGP